MYNYVINREWWCLFKMNVSYYINQIEKQASLGSAVSGATSAISKGVKAFTGMSAGKRMLTGAAVNAGLKGVNYKGDDADGRIKSMAKGALTGAALGGIANQKLLGGMNKLKTHDGIGSAPNNVPMLPPERKLIGAPQEPIFKGPVDNMLADIQKNKITE